MGHDLLYDLRMIDILSERVEAAKQELTANESASMRFTSSDAATLTLHITRDEFNSISKGVFKGVLSLVEMVLNKAKVLGVKIDEVCIWCCTCLEYAPMNFQVLLGGGTAHLPGLVHEIKRQFPLLPVIVVAQPATAAVNGGLLSISTPFSHLASDLCIRTAGMHCCILTQMILADNSVQGI